MRRITSYTETGMRITPPTRDYQPVDDFFLLDEKQDLRGRSVSSERGEIGSVADMLVDPDARRVAMIELTDGRRVPIEMVRLDGETVRLTQD